MNVLFVSPEIPANSGGALFSSEIINILNSGNYNFYNLQFPLYENVISKLKNQLSLRVMGMTRTIEDKIINEINQRHIDVVVFNHSGYGLVTKKIKKNIPRVRVVTIFHNVEYKFVKDSFFVNKNPAQLITLCGTRINEKLCVKMSDCIICLNERDSKMLKSLYNREADTILPICITDRFIENNLRSFRTSKIGAFFGSNFYANNSGIKWFCENVSNEINCKILVIGRGFEEEIDYFKKFSNMELIGTVDSVDPYYYDIDFVVSPIFEGSGMKTKTAEALMFGKTIIGTQESFEGYNIDSDKIGVFCSSATDFINAINYFEPLERKYNIHSRQLYLMNHSTKTMQDLLYGVLHSLI